MTKPAQQLTRPKRSQGRRPAVLDQLSIEQIVTLWRLHRGGITDTKLVQRISGVHVHGLALRAAVAVMDRALLESLPIEEYVRCRGCGGSLASVPCVKCGPFTDAYRFTGKGVPRNAG
jgi:hypothetical protein